MFSIFEICWVIVSSTDGKDWNMHGRRAVHYRRGGGTRSAGVRPRVGRLRGGPTVWQRLRYHRHNYGDILRCVLAAFACSPSSEFAVLLSHRQKEKTGTCACMDAVLHIIGDTEMRGPQKFALRWVDSEEDRQFGNDFVTTGTITGTFLGACLRCLRVLHLRNLLCNCLIDRRKRLEHAHAWTPSFASLVSSHSSGSTPRSDSAGTLTCRILRESLRNRPLRSDTS